MDQRRPRVVEFLAASSLGVFFVEFLLCRWLAPHSPSTTMAFLTAIAYVAVAVLCGAASTWFFWLRFGRTSTISLRSFTIGSAIGWIWVPSVVLLSRQRSIAALPLVGIAAAVMANGLRKIVPHDLLSEEWKPRDLFAEYLDAGPRETSGFLIAVCLYGAFFAMHRKSMCTASFLLALCAFLLTWKWKGEGTYELGNQRRYSALRLARAAPTAVLMTMGLLLASHRNVSSGSINTSAGEHRSTARNSPEHQMRFETPFSRLFGYERIILWPSPERKTIVVPVTSGGSPKSFDLNKPLTIPFQGSYWYFQPQQDGKGMTMHVAHGNPLTVNVRSNGYIPMSMEAHQALAAVVPLKCCREMQVAIENYDNAPGIIALGILLTDSTSPGKPTLYLAQQNLISTQPGHFVIKPSPVSESLRFPIPAHAKIVQFDEITVIVFPNPEHPDTGPKIAIKQFGLIPP